jgi:putative FmdB family regulatory protein
MRRQAATWGRLYLLRLRRRPGAMPIYEYHCKRCDNRFEQMRPMAQMRSPAPCPSCASVETMRLLSLFAARTKGEDATAPCETSQMWGRPCCRTRSGDEGGCCLPTD